MMEMEMEMETETKMETEIKTKRKIHTEARCTKGGKRNVGQIGVLFYCIVLHCIVLVVYHSK